MSRGVLGKYNFGKIPYQTFLDSKSLTDEKMLGSLQPIENLDVREASTVR